MPPKRKNSSTSAEVTSTSTSSKSTKTTKSSTPSTSISTTSSSTSKNPSLASLKTSFLKILAAAGSNGATQDEIEAQNSLLTPQIITQLANSLSGNTIELFIRKKDGKSEPCFVLKKSQSGGLTKEEEFVYQMIAKSSNLGIWTKDIKLSSGLPSQTLTKIYKTLTSKGLIKPFKSVASKTKTLYMLEGIEPAKELTGGPWYTEQEFDFEFISELRTFVLMLIKSNPSVTLSVITSIVEESKISKIKLSQSDVSQLVRTLQLDNKITVRGDGYEVVKNGFVDVDERTGKESGMFSFNFWECLEKDWHWRVVKFGETGGEIGAHEPHHQSN
ncbi:hypothetical protein TrVE_jg5809 [Triparma verrucosa]|uniref:RNA polymerase III subunit C6 n=2 Tax=Triparma TaxID=722752 RepID=A0A9W7F0R0_9STRA|nr:hypothetical protein TrST_g8959 [Triparma strigata]GMI09281.1 hypothetical protein TrVE_jg5809 [Triparma verrucosa]